MVVREVGPEVRRARRQVDDAAGHGICAARLCSMPSATVPSWQLRQSLDAPVGWPMTAFVVVLP